MKRLRIAMTVVFCSVLVYAQSQRKPMFAADERLAARMPNGLVELAQPLEIPIDFTDGNLTLLTVSQRYGTKRIENKRSGRDLGSNAAKVLRDDGLTKTIEITPLHPGTIDIEIVAIFADGGMGRKSYSLEVAPSSKGLKKFYLNQGFPVLAIVLEDKEEDRQVWLSPEVYYSGLDYPIDLHDSTQVQFTVDQPKDDPVIRLDADGMVHGLRPGRATITGHFGGVRNRVIVDVYTKETAPLGYRRVR